MSIAQQVNERLAALTEAGTSVWLDQIRRGLIEGGELQRLVEEDSLRGVTSNPAIFEKAILGSDEYDEQIAELAGEGMDATQIYEEIAIKDVQMAADVLRPVHDATGGADGFVSLEVSPTLAHDTDATLEEARRFWKRLDRPNVMIKIPGTEEGLPAIEEAIHDGININVTLLFSVEAYAKVTEAFIRGLERRHEEGASLDVHSVASFFVSRVDTEVDKRLEDAGKNDLQGLAAVANARAAYLKFKEIFQGERFAALAAAGAPVQRPLWASTGVKNPHYPETKYVDTLVAPHTVNTMPMQTLLAAAEKSEFSGATAETDPTEDLQKLADAGIDLADVTEKLLRDGIAAFVTPFEKLLAGVESGREAVVTGRPKTIESAIPNSLEPALSARVRQAAEEKVAQRIWRKDETLWGEPGTPEIANRLGWLTITEPMREDLANMQAFAKSCKSDGISDVVVLGMGGSSLAPEVFRRSFGPQDGGMTLHVLDSTDAATVLELGASLDMGKTLFVVSSKSGGTIEPNSFMKHFYRRVTEAVGAEEAGKHFVAITDPGTHMVEVATSHKFLHIFQNDPDIGGRYSALSYFGLVPAALMGADVEAILDGAQVAEQACANYDSSASNQGLWMGIALGELALQGHDKLTFVVDDPIASFGLWAEQLVAESTGKHGKGILPVADEPVGDPAGYGDDRIFVHLADAEDPDAENAEKVAALVAAGQPVLTLKARGAADIGRIMFFSEFATAVAGWVLGINPFDQPNVQEAKDNTGRVLDEFKANGALPEVENAGDEALKALLADAAPPNYVAIMGYVQPSDAVDEAVAELRTAIREATGCTTTYGYGPRFLHSTGQFHKGGPPVGRFLQLIHDGPEDADIPGEDYGFTTLKNAQATGDLQTLRSHDLPAERVRLEGDPAAGIKELAGRIRGLLQ